MQHLQIYHLVFNYKGGEIGIREKGKRRFVVSLAKIWKKAKKVHENN
jgi:hypothetical protein